MPCTFMATVRYSVRYSYGDVYLAQDVSLCLRRMSFFVHVGEPIVVGRDPNIPNTTPPSVVTTNPDSLTHTHTHTLSHTLSLTYTRTLITLRLPLVSLRRPGFLCTTVILPLSCSPTICRKDLGLARVAGL